MDFQKRPDGSMSEDTKTLATGAAAGAVIGLLLPGISLIGGLLVGGAVAAVNMARRRG